MRGLTDRQRNVLEFIEDFSNRESMAPTVSEIAEYFDIRAATAFAHLRALQRKGYVDRSSKARSLTLRRGSAPKHLSLTLPIPVLGRISAGLPLLSEEHVEEIVQVDPAMLPGRAAGQRLFGLRVHGQSMRDQSILDNDVIIARQQSIAQGGEVVVALIDGETTVKSFYPSGSRVELRPANPDFKSQFYRPEDVRIQGVVVALVRSYN